MYEMAAMPRQGDGRADLLVAAAETKESQLEDLRTTLIASLVE